MAAASSSPARTEPACQLSLTSLRQVCRSGGRSVGFSEATFGRRRQPATVDGTPNRTQSTTEMGYDCRGTMVLASCTFGDDSESSVERCVCALCQPILASSTRPDAPSTPREPGQKTAPRSARAGGAVAHLPARLAALIPRSVLGSCLLAHTIGRLESHPQPQRLLSGGMARRFTLARSPKGAASPPPPSAHRQAACAACPAAPRPTQRPTPLWRPSLTA